MHELSIAESLISAVTLEMERRALNRLEAVGVRIGALSGVFSDALQFAFEVAIGDTPLEGAGLVIEEVPAQGKCRECGGETEFSSPPFVCASCSSNQIEMTSGFELEIAFLEVEDTE